MKMTKLQKRLISSVLSVSAAVLIFARPFPALASEKQDADPGFRNVLQEMTVSLPLCSASELAAKQNPEPDAPALLCESEEGILFADYFPEAELAAVPHVWPVRLSGGRYISSWYGIREDPISHEQGKFHAAIDIAAESGTKIAAAGSGTVVEASWSGGMGNYVVIDHGNGYRTSYNHCSELLVSEGDDVLQGQPIALVGSTGYATGSHLDFRVFLNGKTINPLSVLDDPD